MCLASSYPADAATAPSLGAAQSFAVLAGTTVTDTGPTSITGDLGVSPGSAITGLGSITLAGATHAGDAVALQAQNDVITAYDALAGAPCTQSFTGTAVQVGGQTLAPGVYCYSSSAQLTGTLTLNGNGVFIFEIASTLTTASGSRVALTGGAQACNVFWQIGSSADLFSSTTFVGNILALTSINLQNSTTVSGRALARNGAVTMDTNTIARSTCAIVAPPVASATSAAASSPTTGPASPTSTAGPASPTSTASAGLVPPAAALPPASQMPPVAVVPPALLVTPPNTGGGPSQGGTSVWLLVLVASAVASLSMGLAIRRRPGVAR